MTSEVTEGPTTHPSDDDTDRYTIRRFEADDTAGFLRLYDAIPTLAQGGGRAWFDWKYGENPYVDRPVVHVAEHEGRIVGARPFVAFRMQSGDATELGLQTADTMVHPDHRKRGLFSRMTEQAFADYRDGDPAFMFSVPNERSRPGYLGQGARVTGAMPAFVRVGSPAALLRDRFDGLADRLPDRTLSAFDRLADAYHGRTRAGSDPPAGVTVERTASVPPGLLADLAGASDPETIHAVRDETFYEWRFANPKWEYATYVARRNGVPVAAAVAGTRQLGDLQVTRVAELLPLSGGEAVAEEIEAILGRLVDAEPATDVFALAGRQVPREVVRRVGFLPDDRLPLAPLSNATVLITMPLGETTSDWRFGGRDLVDPGSWHLPFCEQNTS
jgi:GNAT superfamily N-acetyltransferase